MKILDFHIGSIFFKCFFVIMLILAVLFSFFELLSQLDDVGRGDYRLYNALVFVAFTLPKRLLDLMPISTLLGGIVALGMLADHGELLAMQASGISVLRICATVLIAGMVLIVTAAVVAEMIIPGMELHARKTRAQALTGTGVTLTREGFWARQKNNYIHVGKMLSKGTAADIDIFEFDEDGRLKTYAYAKSANIQNNKEWRLNGITRKVITEKGIDTTHKAALSLGSFLSARQVGVLELPPYSLSAPDLIRYVKALKSSGQNADHYLLALWRKLSIPLTTGAMVLLSLSFIFGSTRNVSAGRRITTGAFIGVALYFADQLIMHLGLLLNVNPFITAWIPVILISGAASWRLRGAI